ncbi:MAG: sulfatase-like hydrolase/transferase [Candidatus Marsarchaeota archaeon]|nr:sulfatase-like hydrolase/transferase [Candidatus Marsarchaeota archaeon]
MSKQQSRPNITVIVLDTLRQDAFEELTGMEGESLAELGNFTTLGKCIAPSPWTLPSHASLFTGMYPSEHGSHESKTVKALDIGKISLKKKTLVGDLNALGYSTYAISANPYVHPVYGFDEFKSFKEESYFTDMWGSVVEVSAKLKPMFAKYRERYGSGLTSSLVKIPLATLAEDPGLFLEGVASGLALTPVAAAKKLKAKVVDNWPLEKGGKRIVRAVKEMELREPSFLFLNLMEAHDPYTDSKKTALNWATPFLKKPVDEKTIELWRNLYQKAAHKAYGYAYDIIENLVERFGDNQIILLTSDHGQEFNEHGFLGHGAALHDEIVRVPMSVLLPRRFSTDARSGYSSLVNVRKFILNAIAGKEDALNSLYSKEVRAESFGVVTSLSGRKDIDQRKLKAYEKTTVRRFRQ